MDETEVRKIVQEEIKNASRQAQYGVARVPVHTHNNIDAPNLPQHSVTGFASLPGASGNGGVADVALLNKQVVSFGETDDQTTVVPNVYVYPLPIIYGNGTTSSDTLFTISKVLTGTPIAGATSATLTVAWAGATGHYWATFDSGESKFVLFTHLSVAISWTSGLTAGAGGTGLAVGLPGVGAVSATLSSGFGGTTGSYAVQFDTGEIRVVSFTNSSTAITWTSPLIYAVGSATITIIANARFHGGIATNGTALIFRNDDDGVLQLWVRTAAGIFTETWASVDLTLSITD